MVMSYEIFYNNKALSVQERIDFCKMADEALSSFSASIDGMHDIAINSASSESEGFKSIMNDLISISTFISYSYCDIIVLTKSFIMSTNPYEKSFLRGKLKVQLNESFKKLYGFTEKVFQTSYCARLGNIVDMFPNFKSEYDCILKQLNIISKQHTWWKDERNAEVHLDIEMLYSTRHEEINESKVVMETIPLIEFFNRLNSFMNEITLALIAHIKKLLNIEEG